MVHDPVKNRAQRKAIVPTERGGESDDRYTMLWSGRRTQNLSIKSPRTAKASEDRVEVRGGMAIGGCSGTVCLIHNNSLQPRRIKLLQSRNPEQCLVCRDGAGAHCISTEG